MKLEFMKAYLDIKQVLASRIESTQLRFFKKTLDKKKGGISLPFLFIKRLESLCEVNVGNHS